MKFLEIFKPIFFCALALPAIAFHAEKNSPLTLILDANLQAIGILKGKGNDSPQVLWGES